MKRHSSTIFTMEHSEIIERTYRAKYRGLNAPHPRTVRGLCQKFKFQGTISDLPRSGRMRSKRTNRKIDLVKEDVAENPRISIRHRCQQLNLSRTTIWRILRKDIQFYLYKIQLVQHLRPEDRPRRTNYGNFAANIILENQIFGKNSSRLMRRILHFRAV